MHSLTESTYRHATVLESLSHYSPLCLELWPRRRRSLYHFPHKLNWDTQSNSPINSRLLLHSYKYPRPPNRFSSYRRLFALQRARKSVSSWHVVVVVVAILIPKLCTNLFPSGHRNRLWLTFSSRVGSAQKIIINCRPILPTNDRSATGIDSLLPA